MDGQLLELWGRWMTAALQGQSQMDMLSGWWMRSFQNISSMNKPYSMSWAMPSILNCNTSGPVDGMKQLWELVFIMQENTLQVMGMVPKEKYEALAGRAEELENKVQDQARTINRLRDLLSQTGGKNNVVVAQLQDLIGQQSQQFKQLTQSVGNYIKSSAEKVSQKK